MSYLEAVMADAPLLWWRLAEANGAGSAADSSGNGKTGTWSGLSGISYGQDSLLTSDVTDKSVLLGPTSTGILVSRLNDAIFTRSVFTLEAWVKLDAAVPANHEAVISITLSDTVRLGFIPRRNASGNKLAFWDSSANGWRESSVSLSLGVTHHIVAVVNGTTVTFYVDGVSAGSVTGSSNVPGSLVNFYVGARGSVGFSDYMRGNVDEVAMFPTALSAARVATHYLEGVYESRRASSMMVAA